MATAPEDSNHIPSWKGASLPRPDAIKTEQVQSEPEGPKDVPPATWVQALPQLVSPVSEEMATHNTALNRLLHAAADLEVAERDERDALAKVAALTAVKQQCLRERDDAKRALTAAGRSCRLAAEAHHAELLRQLAASTASLAATAATATTTSDDDDFGAAPFDPTASTTLSTVAAVPTSTPAARNTSAITSFSTTTSAATLSPAAPHPSDAAPSLASPSQPTGASTNPASIVESGAISTAAYPLPAGLPRLEVSDLPFTEARVEDVRQADGLDRLATEEISFAATRVLRFCSAREIASITVADVVDRASTNSSGDFSCAVSKLVVALRQFHANAEHSWFSSPRPVAASGMLASLPPPRATSSTPAPNHSRPPIITASIGSTGIFGPQHVRCSSTSRLHRTESSSSTTNSCSDDNATLSAAHMHGRRHRGDYSHLRRPANAADTMPSSSSDHPRGGNRVHRAAASYDVSSSRGHLCDVNSTTPVGIVSAPCGRRVGLTGSARLRRDDSRDRFCRSNTRDRLHRDDSRDRIRRDNTRDWRRAESNRDQPRADCGRDRPRADNTRGQRRADNDKGHVMSDPVWDRPRGGTNREGTRPGGTGERPRGDVEKGQSRHGDDRGRLRGNANDDRPRADKDNRRRVSNNDRSRVNDDYRFRTNHDYRARVNSDDRQRANNDGRPRRSNDDRQRANNKNRDRSPNENRDRHQPSGACADGLVDHHPNLETSSKGTSVTNRGRRGHRWGVKEEAPASGLAFDFTYCFAPSFMSGSASTSLGNSKRPTSPPRLTSTRPLQRPRCRVDGYPSGSSGSFDVALSRRALSSNAAADCPTGEAARPLASSDKSSALRAMMEDAAAAALETSSVHAVEQAHVGIGMG